MAALTVALVFASSMVLQRDAPGALWGAAAPGARVSAALACAGCPAPAPAVAGADGAWRVALPPLPATAAPFAVTVSSPGAPDVVLEDVLVGDVLLCSGQSVRGGRERGRARGGARALTPPPPPTHTPPPAPTRRCPPTPRR